MLSVALLGFEPHTETIAVTAGGVSTSITLAVGAFTQEVTVSALLPEVATELTIAADAIERRVARDLAQALRDHAGVTALRRGAINLDPSVRGLYAEQIGIFVDGTRTFAAGPARMDSGLSHVSPHALQSLRVVRGPYALTWGAGTLSAIRADTFKPAFAGGGFRIGGRAGYNYGSNGDANDALASLHGSSDRIRFTFQHNTRIGSDYLDGSGEAVPGDYESFDTRWSLGGRLGGRTLLEYTGGYQKQNDIDYPGRILDATLFETRSHALEVSHVRPTGLVGELAGQIYVNDKRHVMNNDDKPTALPDPHRTPPVSDRRPPASRGGHGRRALPRGARDRRRALQAGVRHLPPPAGRDADDHGPSLRPDPPRPAPGLAGRRSGQHRRLRPGRLRPGAQQLRRHGPPRPRERSRVGGVHGVLRRPRRAGVRSARGRRPLRSPGPGARPATRRASTAGGTGHGDAHAAGVP